MWFRFSEATNIKVTGLQHGITVVRDTTLSQCVIGYPRFETMYYPHPQGQLIPIRRIYYPSRFRIPRDLETSIGYTLTQGHILSYTTPKISTPATFPVEYFRVTYWFLFHFPDAACTECDLNSAKRTEWREQEWADWFSL